MNKKQYTQICDRVTDRILGFLDEGKIPWQKPWVGGVSNAPRSASSKKIYRGTNLALLSCAGYSSPWWLTYNQAKKLGGSVKKDEKSFPVHYWKFHDKVECTKCPKDTSKPCYFCKGTGEYKPLPNLFSFNVFNASQCDGLPEKYYEIIEDKNKLKDFKPIEEAEKIVKGYENAPKIFHDQSDRNFYIPAKDEVHLTREEQFISPEECYSTTFHELVHSTGHKDRLARDGVTGINFFGSHDYSKEELVAELGASFLCGVSGIDREEVIKNSAGYIQSWKKKLSENTDWIVWAGTRASKACDHILGINYSKGA